MIFFYFFFYAFSQTNECIYSRKREKKMLIRNSTAIFVCKFYIIKFMVLGSSKKFMVLVSLVSFKKKKTKININFTTKTLQIYMVI